jgi:hypothetical protein
MCEVHLLSNLTTRSRALGVGLIELPASRRLL